MKNSLSNIREPLAIMLAVVLCTSVNVSFAGKSGNGKARGQLYSTAAVNKFCTGAQEIIANTRMQSENIVWGDLGSVGGPPGGAIPATGFIGSDALPYDIYSGPLIVGRVDEPLTTQQFVGFGSEATGNFYPQTIMCKMKSEEVLDIYYPDSSVDDEPSSCSEINEDSYARVLQSLTNKEVEVVTEVVFDEWVANSGEQWTSQSPSATAYTSTVDGRVHIVGKTLYVPRELPPFIPIPASKKGVHYCQVIAPEFLRQVITGDIVAPNCDAPPVYPSPFGPPLPTPIWDCANP
jgi:hypothetical protein